MGTKLQPKHPGDILESDGDYDDMKDGGALKKLTVSAKKDTEKDGGEHHISDKGKIIIDVERSNPIKIKPKLDGDYLLVLDQLLYHDNTIKSITVQAADPDDEDMEN